MNNPLRKKGSKNKKLRKSTKLKSGYKSTNGSQHYSPEGAVPSIFFLNEFKWG